MHSNALPQTDLCGLHAQNDVVVLSDEFLCQAVSDSVVCINNQCDTLVTVCDIYIVFNLPIEPFDYVIGNLG